MFDTGWVADLDAQGVCEAVAATHRAQLESDAAMLVLAAHWADLHSADGDGGGAGLGPTGGVLPGRQRARRLGGPGTPRVWEFAGAELAAVQGLHPVAGQNLLRDALNLRHRHPQLWARASRGQVRAWQAREVARLVDAAGLSAEQAGWVDAQTTGYLGSLPWGRFCDLVAAKIIEADPQAAEARRQAAAAEQFVATGRSTELGLKTLVARATAGDVIYFVAVVDRIAQILALGGDTAPVGVRRARALGILATPARALAMLQGVTHVPGSTATDPDESPADADADADADAVAEDERQVGEHDVHPAANDADDPPADPPAVPSADPSGDPSAFSRGRGGLAGIAPGRLLSRAVLYVHLSQAAFTRGAGGVARFEDVGPVTIEQAREFLGHTQVTVKPVVDVAGQVPVDAYETPDPMAEALVLRTPADVFPFAVNRGRRMDRDHTKSYLDPGRGGPPGQTHLGNLAPMVRFHHRLKTHGRWRLKQPEPGVYLWRSPHGHHWLVDHTGTHRLPKSVADPAWTMLGRGIDLIPTDHTGNDLTLDYQPAQHHGTAA